MREKASINVYVETVTSKNMHNQQCYFTVSYIELFYSMQPFKMYLESDSLPFAFSYFHTSKMRAYLIHSF